jgi:hypothetical protein
MKTESRRLPMSSGRRPFWMRVRSHGKKPFPFVSLNLVCINVVKVIKVEEKGSDVNLASHLLLDAFQGNYDVAVVLS